jgi:hypothetical protein
MELQRTEPNGSPFSETFRSLFGYIDDGIGMKNPLTAAAIFQFRGGF